MYILWNIAIITHRTVAAIPENINKEVGLILLTIFLEKIKNNISAITEIFNIKPEIHLAEIFILSKYIAL